MSDLALRKEIIRVARLLEPMRLSRGKSGNVSARTSRGFLVTPTGVPYATLAPKHLVELDLDGRVLRGDLAPSSEWRIHGDIYRARAEAGAVVHAHPPYATAFAIAGQPLEAVHYMIAIAGGHDVRVAPYATFGTKELSKHALRALKDRSACLLAHHGIVALGGTPEAALRVADEIEGVAEMQFLARTIGNAPALPRTEMQRVVRKFATYGQSARSAR
jgi:L-fuculose-phosphate aldolase